MLPEIVVLSRDEAEKHEPSAHEVCISITDPRSPTAALSSRFRGLLRLSFHDVPSERLARESDVRFSSEMARAIVSFAKRWADADRIIVHCEQGQSRSAAVGLALRQLSGQDTSAMEQQYPGWNRLVRAVLVRCGELVA